MSKLSEYEVHLSVGQRFRIARARDRRRRLIDKIRGGGSGESAHTTFMNECVPEQMDYGKDQLVAIAACLNMWRDAWEETHPDGAEDPGPDRPEEKE